jgi:peptide deformylase
MLGAPRAAARCHLRQLLAARPFGGAAPRAAEPAPAPPPRRGPPPPAAKGRALQELLGARAAAAREEEEDAAPALGALAWASPLRILKYPDARLRAPNGRVTLFDADLATLVAEMLEVMYDDDGIGLAAPQVGVNARLMVFNGTGDRAAKDAEVALVNPRLVSASRELCLFEEGCLSFPGVYGDVERPARVRVRAQDLQGKGFTMDLSGLGARIFQHEFDHLSGALLCDRLVPEARAAAAPAFAALRAAHAAAHGGGEGAV